MAEHSTVTTSAVRPNEPARQVIAILDNYADRTRGRFTCPNRVRGKPGVGDRGPGTGVRGAGPFGGELRRGGADAVPGRALWWGALIGRIFGLFNWIEPLNLAMVLGSYGWIFGALCGAPLFGIADACAAGR